MNYKNNISLHECDYKYWSWPIAISVVMLISLLSLFYETTYSMVKIWWDQETYAHGFLVMPISAWLIWSKRHYIKQLHPIAEYRALVILAGAGFLWLLGALVNAEVIKQIALVTMLIAGLWVVLGNAVCHFIAFPLAFFYFMVPAGEDLVPLMMEFTATFTVKLLQLTGIPVYRNGLFFSIPSGDWSVVEACSGIRYLLASVTLGCVYAYLTYQSLFRRIVFIVISFIVPVVANGIRAYMIVMIGHLSGMELAVGVDHLIYGWLFFGIVMFILFAIGSKWREPEGPVVIADGLSSRSGKLNVGLMNSSIIAGVTVIVMAMLWPAADYGISQYNVSNNKEVLSVPADINGWKVSGASSWEWRPSIYGATNELWRFYDKNEMTVSLYLGQYLVQDQNSELINTRNVLVDKKDVNWRISYTKKSTLEINSKDIEVEQSHIQGANKDIFVLRVYRLGNTYTANRYIAKLLEIKSKLLFERQDVAVLIVATNFDSSRPDGESKAIRVLNQFFNEMTPGLEQSLDRVVGVASNG